MGIHGRIKTLREYFGLTQEEFGKKINIKSRAHISALENGTRSVTDRIINDICRVYGANKEWLLTGEGEIIHDRTEMAKVVVEMLGVVDPLDIEIIQCYLKLDEKYRIAFRGLLKDLIKE